MWGKGGLSRSPTRPRLGADNYIIVFVFPPRTRFPTDTDRPFRPRTGAGENCAHRRSHENYSRSDRRVRDLERRESETRRKARARGGTAFRGAEELLRSADGAHWPHCAPGDAPLLGGGRALQGHGAGAPPGAARDRDDLL